MSFELKMFLYAVIGLLQSFVKNPKSLASEEAILQQAYDLIGAILAGLATSPGKD
jgi:hypothetical protein